MRGALIWSTGITVALVRSIFNEMMTLRVGCEPGNEAKSGSLALCRRNNRLWREFNTQALFSALWPAGVHWRAECTGLAALDHHLITPCADLF